MILQTPSIVEEPRGILSRRRSIAPKAPPSDFRRGRVITCRLEADPEQIYHVFVPRLAPPDAPVVVTVHGISRNALEHARRFRTHAEEHRAILVAPLFSKERFPDFQRLGRPDRGRRADLVLDAILAEVEARVRVPTNRFYLFGFSGGAQFAHRYAFARPERVIALGLAAAGWYTMPDPETSFPYGLGRCRSLPGGVRFEPRQFLRVPAHVFVGDKDNRRDAALRKGETIDAVQGRNRIARAERWKAAMEAAAASHGYSTRYTLDRLPRTAHSFRTATQADRGRLGSLLFDHFFSG